MSLLHLVHFEIQTGFQCFMTSTEKHLVSFFCQTVRVAGNISAVSALQMGMSRMISHVLKNVVLLDHTPAQFPIWRKSYVRTAVCS